VATVETPAQARVAIADALLARRAQADSPSYDLRETLRTVRESVQNIASAAELKALLASVQAGGPEREPQKDEVSTIQKVVEIGSSLVGTPTEREKALKEELEQERKARRELEEAVYRLRDELHDRRREQRQEERDATIALAEVFQRMMDTFMQFQQRVQQPNENDPLRQIGTAVIQSFVNRSPADDLKHVTETLNALKELGLVHHQPQPSLLTSPEMFKAWLDYQATIHRTDKEIQQAMQRDENVAKRLEGLIPTLGVLGTAVLSRFAGDEESARKAAGQLNQQLIDLNQRRQQQVQQAASQAESQRPQAGRPYPVRCGACGFEFVARQPLERFVCPNCRTELSLAPQGQEVQG
jgi:predicted Zn-ribbon and HTH transcriptional regulator